MASIVFEHQHQQQLQQQRSRREGKGRVLALSRRMYRLLRQNTDTFYVESESSDNNYYFVKFKRDVFQWCSCKDNSTRGLKCKHLFAIEFAIKWGTIKDIDNPLTDVKGDTTIIKATTTKPMISSNSLSYKDDEYTF